MVCTRNTLLKTAFMLLLACALTYTIVILKGMESTHQIRSATFNTSLSNDPDSSCEPRKHVFYLKVHKTGSSTMVNILYRYGDSRNLTFVMPKEFVWFDFPQRFHLFNTQTLYAQEANILCCHTRYNKGPVNLLFPKEKAKYITTLRSPASHFDSVFYWCRLYGPLGLLKHSNPLREFLRAPTAFSKIPFHHKRTLHLLRNPALFELGLDFKYFQNLSVVMSYIEYIDKEFDLVMINDYYDESLILLKELMCWDFQDIWYIKQKVRGVKTPVSEEVRANILSWNQADALLFDHFNKSFWRKVSNMGPRFYQDLQTFRQQNEIIGTTCGNEVQNGKLPNSKPIPKEYQQMCKQMTTQEGAYIEYIRNKMEKKVADADKTLPRENFFAAENSWHLGHDLLYKPVLTTP